MKKRAGIIGGFVFGMGGFLLAFKVFALDRIHPSDELAPGIVVLISIFCGTGCSYAGWMIQRQCKKRSSSSVESEQ